MAEVIVVGAGIVGTAIAARLARSGVDVIVVDRYGPAAGTSSSGEGDLLVSDKLPGPELDLALRGIELWGDLGARAGEGFEFEKKGGLVVAHDEASLQQLWALAAAQRDQGAMVEMVTGDELQQLEPALSRELPGGALYDQDSQVQPMLAVAFHVAELIEHGGRVVRDVDVLAAERDRNGVITALLTSAGKVAVGEWVVNAAGPWSGDLAARLGAGIPLTPRRGHVLVTEPLPPLVRRKVFEASYIGSVHQSDSEWACSSVIEATAGGTMLLGSSRESVGFSHQLNLEIVAAIARRSVVLVPNLAQARLMRAYVGFRPATPDRLPIIGADPEVGRLLHATGHEGAGVGLAQITAELVQNIALGETPTVDMAAFLPSRFCREPAVAISGAPLPVDPSGPPLAANEQGGRVAIDRAPAPGHDAMEAPPSPPFRKGAALGGAGPARTQPGQQSGGRQSVHFRFDGRDMTAPPGTTVAGALLANGERDWRATRRGGQHRGLFCGIGTCFDCLVDVNGEKAVRACLRALADGDELGTSCSIGAIGETGIGETGIGDAGAADAVSREAAPGSTAPGSTAPGPTAPGSTVPGPAVIEVADVVVVGGGPAGMAAAAAAAARGARVVLVEGSARLGGQFFRQPVIGYASEAGPVGPSLPGRFHGLASDPRVELRLGCTVWSASRTASGFVLLLDGGPTSSLRARTLVLATGASELALPFPGWELPGVVTAGAAQALLKSQHVAIGQRVVVAGTGPFLLPVAAALAKAGARVTAVEAARLTTAPRALPGFAAHPAKLTEAASYGWALASHRVRFLTGKAVIRCQGNGRVERAVVAKLGPGWRPVPGSEQTIEADAVCVSYGFVPRIELARQLDARDASPVGPLPSGPLPAGPLPAGVACDATMATSTTGLFVAGELAGVAGAEVAELEGELAGHAAASLIGLPDGRPVLDRERHLRRLRTSRAFVKSLDTLYPLAAGWTSWLDPSTVFCRCEQTTWEQVGSAVSHGATRAREVRSLTRCGMGYCQGRTCGPALQLAISALTGDPVDRVGDLQKRPVAVPVGLGQVADLAGTPLR